MNFKSIGEYKNMLLIQIIMSWIISFAFSFYPDYLVISLVMFLYSLFCGYLLFHYNPEIEATEPDELFMNYLKSHPDMCKFTSECNMNDAICHSIEHKNCRIYLEKEWK